MAWVGRAVFRLAARGRTHPDGTYVRLNARLRCAASGCHRLGRGVLSLEIVDHNLCDRHQRQGQRQPPDAEHDAEQASPRNSTIKKFPTALTVPNSNLKVWLTMAPPLEASAPTLGKLCVGAVPGVADESADALELPRSK